MPYDNKQNTDTEKKYKIQIEDIITLLNDEIVIEILQDYGETPYRTTEKELWFRTCCHGGESHKLCFYKKTKQFYCYTSCGSMSIFNLLMKLYNGMTFSEAIKYVANKVGITGRRGLCLDKHKENVVSGTELNELDSYATRRRKRLRGDSVCPMGIVNGGEDILFKLPQPMDSNRSSIMNYFDKDTFCGQWLDEGITVESMRKFNIRWYAWRQSVVIPHLNENGELIGIRRRSYLEEDILSNRKYMPLIVEGKMYEHPLGLNLYGLYEHKKAIDRLKQIVVVEAEKSVLLSDGFYGEDSTTVAVCGFNITNVQAEMILSHKVEEVILGFDKDYNPLDYEDIDNMNTWSEDKLTEYKKYKARIARLYSLAKKLINFCKVSVIWDRENLLGLKDSPYDKGKEVFEKLMTSRITLSIDDIIIDGNNY